MFRGITCEGDKWKLWVMKFPKEEKNMEKYTTV